MEVIIPSFINAHLFWIIEKGDILLRSAMHRTMSTRHCKIVKDPSELYENQMVAIHIDDVWIRALVEDVVTTQTDRKFLCWLPDYGVMRSVCSVFHLPEALKECPPLAKQASLINVVNLATDLLLGDNGYELKLKKTVADIEGVRQVALDYIGGAEKILFDVQSEDRFNLYGDIICVYPENCKKSLTEALKHDKLLAEDEKMFETIDAQRRQLKDIYFQHSPNWQQSLGTVEKKKLAKIIFNQNKTTAMDFFKNSCNFRCDY